MAKTKTVAQLPTPELTPVTQLTPNGTTFGIVKLECDSKSSFPVMRIVQNVTQNGVTKTYVTESRYVWVELSSILEVLINESFADSIKREGVHLTPIKGKIHWCEFTPDFLTGVRGTRVNPENGESY